VKLQYTDEWWAAKLGKVGASHISDVMAKTKSGYGATRKNYMMKLLVERLTGTHEETYTNAAMQRGIDEEPMANAEYELQTGNMVTQVGFVDHPDVVMAGASPDGLVGDDGLVEIKCPNTATHVDTLLGAPIDRAYMLQMQWQMACTSRQWCDFVSYDSRMPPKHQLVIRRVERDDSLIAEITHEVKLFLHDLDVYEAKLK